MAKERKKKKKFFLVRLYHTFLYVFLFFLIITFVWQFYLPSVVFAEPPQRTSTLELRKDGFYTFLLIGSDNGDYNADTIMVVGYDSTTATVNLVSIPRDTLVSRTWSSFPKINASFSKGIDVLAEEVSLTLGIPIDFYVQVGLDAFISVVDTLGGLEFHVPQDMYHDDEGGFIIDLQEGLQVLDGRHALELVRYRGYATADIGRTQTQQAVMKALAEQMMTISNLSKWKSYWEICEEEIKTDLITSDFVWFAQSVLKEKDSFTLQTHTLTGVGNATYNGYTWCFALDKEATVEAVNLYLNPFVTDRTIEDMVILSGQ
ncbi:MAG: LCP family protein [Eubacteriales bacterium]